MKVSFVKVQIEEAGRAWAVCYDGSMTDYMIHSHNGVYSVKKFVGDNWSVVEKFDTLSKAKMYCKPENPVF